MQDECDCTDSNCKQINKLRFLTQQYADFDNESIQFKGDNIAFTMKGGDDDVRNYSKKRA